MNLRTNAKWLFLLVALLGLLLASSGSAGAVTGTTFVVNSTADSGDALLGDGVCADPSGNCTLRAAIQEANSTAGTYTINFSLGTTCTTSTPCTIAVASALPYIQRQLFIDGWTQGESAYTGPPLIVLAGPGSGSGLQFLYLGSGSTVRGLSIGGFSYGITGNSGATALTIQGNYLGLKPDGTALPNQYGVGLSGGSGYIIGGSGAGEGNVISGNSWQGISLAGVTSSTIRGNKIGTKPDGAICLGNGNHGISLGLLGTGPTYASSSNTIGGVNLGDGNIIACNSDTGVMISGDGTVNGINNAVRGNAIWGNGGLGIDLVVGGVYGVTANDMVDADTGPNNLQNFPVVTGASSDGTNTTITGTLNSVASATYTLDFYNNATCDPSGYGEGQKYLASTSVTTDGSGNNSFSAGFADVAGVTLAQVTATATDAAGNTSEFSQCFAAAGSTPAIAVSPASLPGGQVGVAYSSTTITAAGGTSPYIYDVSVGTLPAGLSLSSGGVVSGTPTAAGSSTFTIRATDAGSYTGTKEYTVVIAPAIALSPASLPGGRVGVTYLQTISASGGTSPYTYSVLTGGALPAGLSLNTTTGAISGTPTTAGSSTFTIQATDSSTSSSYSGTQAYTVVIAPGSTTSAPVVSTQPMDQSVNAGGSVTFTAAASGDPAPTVQWQFRTGGKGKWNNILGATSTSLTIGSVTSDLNGNQYHAVFTNPDGSATTQTATLSVLAAPVTVVIQPASQTVVAGQNATFTASADGNPTPTVQWQVSTDGGSSWNNMSGATDTKLTLKKVMLSMNGYQYRAEFTNPSGSKGTSAATLFVKAR